MNNERTFYMDFTKTNALLTIILLLLFVPFRGNAGNQENQLIKAIQLYDTENYSEAEQVLKLLLDEKPDHLMVNYYYGACRTENGHYGTNEIIYLLNGSTGESPLKTDYYLGIQYHAKNRWDDALKHYTRYKTKTNAPQQEEVQLSEKIQQCYEKINPFITDEENNSLDVLPAAIPRENEIVEYNPDLVEDSSITEMPVDSVQIDQIDSFAVLMKDEPISTDKETLPKTKPINFVIDGELNYLDSTHFRTKNGLKYYTKGKLKETQLNRQTLELDVLRSKYSSSNSYSEKQKIGEKILAAETDNYKLQRETTTLLKQAKQAEIEYWQTAPSEEKETFIKNIEMVQTATQKAESTEIIMDSAVFVNPNLLVNTPEAANSIEEGTGEELIYKIQLGAYSRGLPNYVEKLFKKLSYIRKIENYTDKKGVVVYTTGNLKTYDDALIMQNQVRQEGVEDAFVVPYFNGKRITLKEAKEIEAGT